MTETTLPTPADIWRSAYGAEGVGPVDRAKIAAALQENRESLARGGQIFLYPISELKAPQSAILALLTSGGWLAYVSDVGGLVSRIAVTIPRDVLDGLRTSTVGYEP